MEKPAKDWEHWLEKQVETLYKKDTENLISSKHIKRELITKHISMLEATKTNEHDYFWKDVGRANLLAYLYLRTDVRTPRRTKDAKELIQKSLKIEPTSVAALANNFQLAKVEKISKQAKEILVKLNALEDREDARVLHIVAMAEVAYCLEYLGPDFYMLSIEKHEKAFTDLGMLSEEEKALGIVSNKKRMWQFHLARTYNRMMNRGNTMALFSKRYDKDLQYVFQRTTSLLLDIIDSKDPFYHGKALIELVDFYKKYETNGGDPRTRFPYKKGPDECVNDAYNIGTQLKDPYVLERCGRHYRQRARNEKEFLFAVEVLQEAVSLCETRHVAWHHLGLTYRSLWLNAGGYKESRLSTNRARRGHTKPKKRKFQQTGTGQHIKSSSACANPSNNIQERSQNSTGKNPKDDIQSRDSGSNSWQSRRSTLDETNGKTDNANNKTLLLHSTSSGIEESTSITKPQRQSIQSGEKEENLTTPPPSLPTLLPRFPNTLGNTPKHQNKPDYLDKYRVSNPRIEEKVTTDKATYYFNEAIECLKKATKLANNTSCRYLLDLGRLYISKNKFSEAEECFQLADNSEPNDNDAQYLYEQWALLRAKLPDEDSNGTEDIKDMYRHSIRSALKANVKSKIAFYNLLQILKDEKIENPDDKLLHLEHAVLLSDVHRFNQAEGILKNLLPSLNHRSNQAEDNLKNLLESLKNDPEKVNVLWQLVALYHQRGQRHDAAAAYTYLTALEKAGQLHMDDCEDEEQRKQRVRMIIELARKDFEENETERKLKQPMRQLTIAPEDNPEIQGERNRQLTQAPEDNPEIQGEHNRQLTQAPEDNPEIQGERNRQLTQAPEDNPEIQGQSNRQLTLDTKDNPEIQGQSNKLKSNPYFNDVFRWIVGNKRLSEMGFKGKCNKDIDEEYKETDICLLTFEHISSETADTTASRLLMLLQDWCDLDEQVSCLPDDIGFNHKRDEVATAILSKAKAVAIVLDDRSSEADEQNEQQDLIDELKKLKLKKNICFVVGENQDSDYRRRYDWPCFVLNQECTDCCIVSSFFQFLFSNTTSD